MGTAFREMADHKTIGLAGQDVQRLA